MPAHYKHTALLNFQFKRNWIIVNQKAGLLSSKAARPEALAAELLIIELNSSAESICITTCWAATLQQDEMPHWQCPKLKSLKNKESLQYFLVSRVFTRPTNFLPAGHRPAEGSAAPSNTTTGHICSASRVFSVPKASTPFLRIVYDCSNACSRRRYTSEWFRKNYTSGLPS